VRSAPGEAMSCKTRVEKDERGVAIMKTATVNDNVTTLYQRQIEH
jgi:hypothetical protein